MIKKEVSRQRLWQIKKQAEGKCIICAQKVSKTNKHLCETHRVKANQLSSNWQKKNKSKYKMSQVNWLTKNPNYHKEYHQRRKENGIN